VPFDDRDVARDALRRRYQEIGRTVKNPGA
jgi:hypothetical protein